MAKTKDANSLTKRRSPRLKHNQAANKAFIAAPEKSISAARTSRRRHPAGISLSINPRGTDALSVSQTKPERASGSDRRWRSRQITQQELERRENSLLQKEEELETLSADLEQRKTLLKDQETQASLMISQIADRETETILNQLEEHFRCSLCYEVLAAPYSLNPSRCGHTFCGICILKWFFSRLHRHCGTWHESVDCPMCRSLLIITPEHTPRLQLTFPFVPNRVAASVIESLVEKLLEQPASSKLKVKREEIESMCTSKSRKKCQTRLRNGTKSKEVDSEEPPASPDAIAWREGGRLREDWLERDKEGKEEMTYLLNTWSTMRAQDFISMKEKLGV